MPPDKLVDENDPWHVGCQDKSGPGKIHEVILVQHIYILFCGSSAQVYYQACSIGSAASYGEFFLNHLL